MKTILRFLALSLLMAPSLFSSSPVAATEIKNKEEAVASIEKRKAEMIKLSDQIWAFAETALREHKSSKALADYAEREGFKVERGVSGMPTGFIASYGQGRP
ncbi:MAG TPA: amidohydrolase, partial [Blastocatellia bacterium]